MVSHFSSPPWVERERDGWWKCKGCAITGGAGEGGKGKLSSDFTLLGKMVRGLKAHGAFVFFKDGKLVDALVGADPSSLANKVAKVAGLVNHSEPPASVTLGMAFGPTVPGAAEEFAKINGSSGVSTQLPSSQNNELNSKLQQLIDSHPVMLLMKRSPEEPKCSFSQKIVEILKKEKVAFGSFDILLEEEVREGVLKFSNCPTFPQLYCKGKLLGWSDIAISMHESGELKEVFRGHGIKTTDSIDEKEAKAGSGKPSVSTGLSSSLSSRLETLVNSSSVMLFMKGKPEEPKCCFSQKVVEKSGKALNSIQTGPATHNYPYRAS